MQRAIAFSRVLRWSTLALLTWGVLVPLGRAHADDYETYRAAREAFLAQDYEAAASGLEALVAGPVPRVEGPLLLEARKYLGASALFLGRPEQAEAQFEALLIEDPQHELDPVAFSSDVVALFTAVRQRLAAARAEEIRQAEEAAAAQRQAERARIAELERALAERSAAPPERAENSRWIAAIPFGVGQFQNGDETLGWLFAGVGVTTAISSIVGAVLYHSLTNELSEAIAKGDEDQFDDIQDARDGALLANRLSFAAFGVAAIASIVEAQVRFRLHGPTEEDEEGEGAASASLQLRPWGAGLTIAF